MRTLLEIQDELSTARNFIECAFMASQDLPREQAEPLAAVLNAASDKLKEIRDAIDAVRQQEATDE